MRDDPEDLAQMTEWLNRPHVKQWWDPDEPALDVEGVRRKYVPRTREGSLTTSCIIELDDRPLGYLQFYRWADHPDEVDEMGLSPIEPGSLGLDIFIGEPDLVGIGLGTAAVKTICGYLVRERGATDVSLATDVANGRAQRCYERAGFRRVRQVLDTDTRNGERALCWLMRWRPAPIIQGP